MSFPDHHAADFP